MLQQDLSPFRPGESSRTSEVTISALSSGLSALVGSAEMDFELEQTRRWIDAARGGQREAYDELFRAYRAELTRAARRLGAWHGQLESSDVVQEAMADAVRNFDGFEYRGEGSFRRWLHKLLENRVRMAWKEARTQKRDSRRQVQWVRSDTDGSRADAVASLADSNLSPTATARRREAYSEITAALERLSPDHSDVIRLVKLRELSLAEVATTMGRSENAVKKLLARALLELRGVLGHDPG